MPASTLAEFARAEGLSMTRYMLRELEHLAHRDVLTSEQGAVASDGFVGLTITRFPADWLRPRMWALRHDLSAYDATYVVLAEMTAATALLTTDARLARAPGIKCSTQLL